MHFKTLLDFKKVFSPKKQTAYGELKRNLTIPMRRWTMQIHKIGTIFSLTLGQSKQRTFYCLKTELDKQF